MTAAAAAASLNETHRTKQQPGKQTVVLRSSRRTRSSTSYKRRTYAKSRKKKSNTTKEVAKKTKEPSVELSDLSEEVLVMILEHVSAPGLVNMSKTCWLFHRLCLTDTIWKHRCMNDFNLHTKWPEFSYLYLYEMFFKAATLRDDQNFFKPVSQLKTSVIVWYLINPLPPCHVVSHLTASQVKSIWNISEEELEETYFDESEDRPEMFPLCHYEWGRLYHVFMKKHGGIKQMQNYVLKRCYRNRQALEEHYKLSLHASRRQKWYQYLEDRDVGNREALKALTEHMPKVTYIYMLHQITAMYIDGNLKGGFQTVKAYAEFCALFKSWMEERSLKIWPPRHGEVLAQDYRDALDYVNKQLAIVAEERELNTESFTRTAQPFIERLHEVWLWQNQHGTGYRKAHRSSIIVRRHEFYRKYLECGRLEDFIKLRAYFERREILSHWLKDNIWLISVLGEAVIRSLRPPVLSPDYTFPVLGNDPVACLVQRFLETGLRDDFNKIRMKLSELASLQIDGFYKKARRLHHSILTDSMQNMFFTPNPNHFPQRSFMLPPPGPLQLFFQTHRNGFYPQCHAQQRR